MPARHSIYIATGLLIFMNASARADDETHPDPADFYEAREFEHQGDILPFRFLTPQTVEGNRKYPLLLFLHGAGERGTDNSKQLVHGLKEFVKPGIRQRFPCFIVAPQCPSERRWVEVDWTSKQHDMPETMSVPLRLTWKLLQEVTENYPVDKNRIYITGLSMGGYGVWDLVQRQPDCFAAAVPICGGGDEEYAERLVKLPIWAFHGDQDNVVPVIRSTRMIVAIKQAGGHPKLTIYPGVGHDSWTATYANTEVLEWMFSQRKTEPER